MLRTDFLIEPSSWQAFAAPEPVDRFFVAVYVKGDDGALRQADLIPAPDAAAAIVAARQAILRYDGAMALSERALPHGARKILKTFGAVWG